MVINDKALSNVDKDLRDSIRQLDISTGSMYDLQVLSAGDTEEKIEAIAKQGGKLAEANKARNAVGLWDLAATNNFKLTKKTWSKSLKDASGVLVVFLNHRRRLKTNKLINNSIDYVKDVFENISVDRLAGSNFDSILVYKGKIESEEKPKSTKKKSSQTKSTEKNVAETA